MEEFIGTACLGEQEAGFGKADALVLGKHAVNCSCVRKLDYGVFAIHGRSHTAVEISVHPSFHPASVQYIKHLSNPAFD